jgi:tetratricopeptide (TPR) repeat protein
MSSGSSSRPPRRDGDSRGAGDGRRSKPGDARRGQGSARRSGDDARRSAGGARSNGSSSRDPSRPARGNAQRRGAGPARRQGGSRPADGRSSGAYRRPGPPKTEAERRALEVKARRAPRAPRDPAIEQERIESREIEQWVDEGSVRRAASGAVRRAAGGDAVEPAAKRRPPRPLDPEVTTELTEALGKQRGARLSERLAQASEALDRERFQEAGRIAASIAKEAPSVAAAHEIVGLANYRLGRYKQAAKALESAQDLHPEPAMLPVIADCYRAQRRWSAVDRVWAELKAASPSHEVMAEGRIVAAGSLADRGELRDALAVMEPATKRPKAVRELHLRQWYVIADLYDRVGDPINARRWFGQIADHDPDFADVQGRLRGLGR